MSRVKFNVHSPEWSQCMATCPKYSRARVPSFTDQAEFEEVFTWVYNTTINPVTNTLYPDAFTQSLWLPFRYSLIVLYYSLVKGKSYIQYISVILKWKGSGGTTTLAR